MCFEMLPGVSYCLSQFEQDRLRSNVEKFQQQAIEPQVFRLLWQIRHVLLHRFAQGCSRTSEHMPAVAANDGQFSPGRPGGAAHALFQKCWYRFGYEQRVEPS